MRRARHLALAVAAVLSLAAAAAAVPSAAWAAGKRPTLHLSTTTLTPGRTYVITGSHWKPGTSINAVLCGADAVDGDADCAPTTTDTMVATSLGNMWSVMSPRIPPQPCPCVILFTGTTTSFTQSVPVTVVGAPYRAVHTRRASAGVTVRDVRVVGGTTLDSTLGASALRTIELRVTNSATATVTPVLVARWGSGADLTNVITMPDVGAIGPGQSRTVQVPFRLGAFSIGTYRVLIQAQVAGNPQAVTVLSVTTQWPIGLFVLAAFVLGCLLYMAALLRRRRPGEPPGWKDPESNVAAPARAGPTPDAIAHGPSASTPPSGWDARVPVPVPAPPPGWSPQAAVAPAIAGTGPAPPPVPDGWRQSAGVGSQVS